MLGTKTVNDLSIEEIRFFDNRTSLEKREPDEHPAIRKINRMEPKKSFLFNSYKPSLKNLGSSNVSINEILCESSKRVAEDSLNLAKE